MSVPTVYKQYNNVIIMEYIDGDMLKDVEVENPKEFFNLLMKQIKIMKNEAKIIHGDLSEFNILVSNGIPVIIDWGSGMLIKGDENLKKFYDLFERDIGNIVRYFNKRYGLGLDFMNIIETLK